MIKFVIVTQPRCGTYWLMSLLDARPDVLVRGEVFNRNRPPVERTAKAALAALFRDTGKYEAQGTAFHPSVAQKGEWSEGLYDELLADPEIKIVRMWRRNMLHMAVSLKEAEKTGWWRVLPKDREAAAKARVPVRLGRDFLLENFARWEAERAEFEEKFKKRDQLVLWYEEEAGKNPAKKIQEYLGLQHPVDVAPGYLQQRADDRVEPRVSNYKEVVATLKGTKYESWLDTEPKR